MKNRVQSSINHLKQAVADIKIQGAMAIATATIEALTQCLAVSQQPDKTKDWLKFESLAKELSSVRPTEPMTRNLTKWYLHELKNRWQKGETKKHNWFELVYKVEAQTKYLIKEIEARIGHYGCRLVRQGYIVFTHCHSSLAEAILLRAKQRGTGFSVYHTETRPLFQGRITSKHLTEAGIKATMVADGAAAWLVSNHSGDDVPVSLVLLGADSVGRDGAVVNKIGSFAIALAAYDSSIPVWVATTLLKVETDQQTEIELRPGAELWPNAPQGTKIINYTFDRIPAKYITGLITEFGTIKTTQVQSSIRQHYPWLLKVH